jgi:hypothetical protein
LLLLSSYLGRVFKTTRFIKQHLMTKLIRSGFYQNHVQELSGYTLSELEKEYEAVKRLKKAELH